MIHQVPVTKQLQFHYKNIINGQESAFVNLSITPTIILSYSGANLAKVNCIKRNSYDIDCIILYTDDSTAIPYNHIIGINGTVLIKSQTGSANDCLWKVIYAQDYQNYFKVYSNLASSIYFVSKYSTLNTTLIQKVNYSSPI